MKNKTTQSSGHGNGKGYVFRKYEANLRKNGFLHFQIGLIVSLLLVYGIFQIGFPKDKEVAVIIHDDPFVIEEPTVVDFDIIKEKPEVVEQVAKKNPNVLPDIMDEFELKNNTEKIEEEKQKVASTEVDFKAANFTPEVVGVDEGDEAPEFYDIKAVQVVPIFPGCEDLASNEEKTACLSEKISALISRNFDADKAVDYGLHGVQKIYVQFNIDKDGNVTDIKSRAAHKVLKVEAERVIKKIPQLVPGKVQGENVVVRYMVPIVFKVQ